jgi:hypothetical protein
MRRREVDNEPGLVAAPAELVNCEVWCANRGLVAFGVYGTPAGDAAEAQHREYLAARREWAEQHGVDAGEMERDGLEPFYGI